MERSRGGSINRVREVMVRRVWSRYHTHFHPLPHARTHAPAWCSFTISATPTFSKPASRAAFSERPVDATVAPKIWQTLCRRWYFIGAVVCMGVCVREQACSLFPFFLYRRQIRLRKSVPGPEHAGVAEVHPHGVGARKAPLSVGRPGQAHADLSVRVRYCFVLCVCCVELPIRYLLPPIYIHPSFPTSPPIYTHPSIHTNLPARHLVAHLHHVPRRKDAGVGGAQPLVDEDGAGLVADGHACRG